MTNFTQHLPTWLKRSLRIILYWLLDTFDSLVGRNEAMIPPRMVSLIVGSGDFKKTGIVFLGYFIRYVGLRPDHHVLEIGAGYGRMALGLTNYITSPGSYDGIEIIKKAVDWSVREINSRYPHFRFHHADVHNRYSNQDGKKSAKEYLVPFSDNSFDVVILTSVFSHMLPQDINHYLSEIRRVLKVDGRCFITYYLLDDYAEKQIQAHRASQPFYHAFDGYLSTSRTTPENTVAYPETTVRELYARNGLKIEEPILYGSWSGRDNFLSYQDVVIARKELVL
ncbi:MAG: Class SAM-dependent methyltransferase [Pseudomonadota bacterium]|nr:Class SAM-dependent methyltransferase [Pseudomonadota bacterium]